MDSWRSELRGGPRSDGLFLILLARICCRCAFEADSNLIAVPRRACATAMPISRPATPATAARARTMVNSSFNSGFLTLIMRHRLREQQPQVPAACCRRSSACEHRQPVCATDVAARKQLRSIESDCDGKDLKRTSTRTILERAIPESTFPA